MDYSFDFSFLNAMRDEDLPRFVTRRTRRVQEDMPRSPEFTGMSTPLTPLYGPYRAVSTYSTNEDDLPPYPDHDVSSLSGLSPNLPPPPSFTDQPDTLARISPPRIPWHLSPVRPEDDPDSFTPARPSPIGSVVSPVRISPPTIPWAFSPVRPDDDAAIASPVEYAEEQLSFRIIPGYKAKEKAAYGPYLFLRNWPQSMHLRVFFLLLRYQDVIFTWGNQLGGRFGTSDLLKSTTKIQPLQSESENSWPLRLSLLHMFITICGCCVRMKLLRMMVFFRTLPSILQICMLVRSLIPPDLNTHLGICTSASKTSCREQIIHLKVGMVHLPGI